mmetsp:Transcript_2907/g.5165  ORF Transcript_2907/g.5165 Transcript_2907/m.5165 type:complete len:213 (-) Transcript_2907:298-936(-)
MGVGHRVFRGNEFVATVRSFHDIVDIRAFVFSAVVVFRDTLSVTVARGIDFSFIPSRLDLGSRQCLWLRLVGSVCGRDACPTNKGTIHHHVGVVTAIGIRLQRPATFNPSTILEVICLATAAVVAHTMQVRLRAPPASFKFLATAGEPLQIGIGRLLTDGLHHRVVGVARSGRESVEVEVLASFSRTGDHHDVRLYALFFLGVLWIYPSGRH